MTTELNVRASLVEKIRFEGRAHSADTVSVDYPAPRGDDQGWMPLELLLLSLATCSGQVILGILRKMRQPVAHLEVAARGLRRDENPAVLTQIDLEFTFRGEGLDLASLGRAVKLAEEEYCPVWAMLRNGTHISAAIVIVEPEAVGRS